MLNALLMLLAFSWMAICAVLLYYLVVDARVIKEEGSTRLIPLWLSILLSPVFSCALAAFFYLLLPFLLLEMILRRTGIIKSTSDV